MPILGRLVSGLAQVLEWLFNFLNWAGDYDVLKFFKPTQNSRYVFPDFGYIQQTTVQNGTVYFRRARRVPYFVEDLLQHWRMIQPLVFQNLTEGRERDVPSLNSNVKYGVATVPEFHGESDLVMGAEVEFNTRSPHLVEGERDDPGFRYMLANTVFADKPFFGLVEEASCHNGWEINSEPATLKYHKEKAGWDVLEHAERMGAYLNERVGIHIHVNAAALGPYGKHKLLWFVHNHKDELIPLVGRDAPKWARFVPNEYLTTKEAFIGKVTTHQPDGGIVEESFNHAGKNSAAATYEDNATVELRMFAATLKKEQLFRFLELTDALARFTRARKRPSMVRTLREPSVIWSRFCRYVGRTSCYSSLWKYMQEKQVVPEAIVDVILEEERKNAKHTKTK